MANPFNIGTGADSPSATTLQDNPFNLGGLPSLEGDAANTTAGIAYNTVVGLPSAAGKVLKDTGQAVARDFFGVGLSLGNAINTFLGRDTKTTYSPTGAISQAVLGEPTDDLAKRIVDAETAIKASPTAQKFGLDKQAGPLAFGGVIGSVALDFTPAGGEENIIKQLAKEGSEEGIVKILTKTKVPIEIAQQFAPKFAETSNPSEVSGLLDLMKSSVGADNLSKEASTIAAKGAESSLPESQSQIPRELSTQGNPPESPAIPVSENPSLGGNIPQNAPNINPNINQVDHIAQFTKALQDAKPLRAEQEALYTETRAQRIQAVQDVQKTTTGEAGFQIEKSKLAGEMPKVQFEALRDSFSQDQIDSIFNAVKDSTNLDSFEQISARNGLAKMFDGAVPTEGEIKLLGKVFPEETVKAMLDKRFFLAKLGDGVINTLNIPRSIMSSFDLSAPFRQGIFMSGRKEFYQSFSQMFNNFGSEEAFKAAQEDIFNRPSYPMMKDAKLAITEEDGSLSAREERFMSNYAEKIPVAGNVIRASGRAYTGFLNKVRADVFDSLISKAKDSGVPITNDLITDLGGYINNATGRGSIGAMNRSAGLLNAVLFSPRLLASRLNLLNPVYYVKLNPFVRKEALKDLFRFTSMATTVLSLAAAGGAKVNLNPTNADFLKMKIGNTRIDVLGGFQQYIRIASQLLAGKITSSTSGKTLTLGAGYKPLTRLDILERFFQGKENPVASFVTDWLQGQDLVGNKFKIGPELLSRFTPLITQDMFDVFKDGGMAKGLGVTLAGLFGFGTQTYKQTNSSSKSSGNPFNI